MMVSLPVIDLALVEGWLREAGEIALSRRKKLEISIKTDNTLVTDADQQIEKFLVENIIKSYPGHQVRAEEGGIRGGNSEFLWAIDPIDGTRAFVSGLPIWGISIGILHHGEPYAGALYMPATREIYSGSPNGAFYNEESLHPCTEIDIQSPLAFMAVPSNAHLLYDISCPRLRSLGSTTAHLAYVARGVATAALTRRVRIWDIAAVLPILSIVGIQLTYLSGKPFLIHDLLSGELSPEPIVAAPINLLDEIRGLIQVKPSNRKEE
jgi:myo-inositol-1(or 4)-monophosphatase